MSDQLLSSQIDPTSSDPVEQVPGAEGVAARVWMALLRSHAGLRRVIAHRLHEEHGLSVSEYEALLLLERATDKRLRGVDLAAGLQLTPSGVTRLLDGLRERGLVERVHCPNDGRVTWAVLRPEGEEKLRAAACAYASTITGLLADRFTAAELETLAELLARLPGATSCPSLQEQQAVGEKR